MKKIYLLAASASVALGLASCDIDDVENIGEMSAGNFPATETDALSMLAGVYQGLNNVMEDPQSSSFIYTALLASDDMLGGGGENDKLMQAVDLLCNYNADMTNLCFTKKYDVINRANGLLQAFGSASLADDVKNKMMGEALFLRAFNYYTLASMYGNVPVRTVPGSDVVPQGEITDVWKQILQDLRDAVKLLPAEKTTTAGRVDKYAAEAMLGRAWLFYAGMFCNGTSLQDMVSTSYNEDAITSVVLPDGSTLTKQDVISAIDDCVENSGYSLNTDFRALWAYSNRCTKGDCDAFYPGIKDVTWAEDDGAVNLETLFAVKFSKFASWNTTIGYANGLALHLGVRGGQDYGNTFPIRSGLGRWPGRS